MAKQLSEVFNTDTAVKTHNEAVKSKVEAVNNLDIMKLLFLARLDNIVESAAVRHMSTDIFDQTQQFISSSSIFFPGFAR